MPTLNERTPARSRNLSRHCVQGSRHSLVPRGRRYQRLLLLQGREVRDGLYAFEVHGEAQAAVDFDEVLKVVGARGGAVRLGVAPQPLDLRVVLSAGERRLVGDRGRWSLPARQRQFHMMKG